MSSTLSRTRLLLLPLVMVALGCENNNCFVAGFRLHSEVQADKIDEYIGTHPELDDLTADALKSRSICVGMSAEHVELVCGNAIDKLFVNTWELRDQYTNRLINLDTRRIYLYFTEGKLAAIIIRGFLVTWL